VTTISSYESSLSPTTEKNYPRFSGIAELVPKICPPNTYCSDDGFDYYHICPHGYFPYITGCEPCPDSKFCLTSFNYQVDVTPGSVSTNADSFPRFQPQGYTWSSNAWVYNKDFNDGRSALGRVEKRSVYT